MNSLALTNALLLAILGLGYLLARKLLAVKIELQAVNVNMDTIMRLIESDEGKRLQAIQETEAWRARVIPNQRFSR